MADTHTIMPKKLAQALMEAGMHHFDAGGTVSAMGGGMGPAMRPGMAPATGVSSANPLGGSVQVGSGQSAAAPIGGTLGSLLGGSTFSGTGATINPGTNNGQLNTGYGQVQQGLRTQQGLSSNMQPGADQAIANQQALAQQLLAQSQGNGPNPAATALSTNTGNNVANQAALMAGARGASSNPALIAALAAKQGGNLQQQATGQEATLEAEQRLAAQRELGALSGQQVGQTQNATSQANLDALREQEILQGANSSANNAAVTSQGNVNNVNAAISAANAKQGGALGGLLNGISGGVQGIGNLFGGGGISSGDITSSLAGSGTAVAGGFGDAAGMAGGAEALAPEAVMLASHGAKVPGKPEFKGNDPRNDVVPALLSKGEEVLPNSVTQAPDAPDRAKEFVKHLQEEDKKKKGKKDVGYAKVAKAKGTLKERVEALEKCLGGKI